MGNYAGYVIHLYIKRKNKAHEIEPAYRTGRHDEYVTHWDDYQPCDLPEGRDSIWPLKKQL
jgi:hypothetical protein